MGGIARNSSCCPEKPQFCKVLGKKDFRGHLHVIVMRRDATEDCGGPFLLGCLGRRGVMGGTKLFLYHQ